MSEELVFVGPGRAGLALGAALRQEDGSTGLTYFGRRPEPPSHPLFTQGHAEYVFGLEQPGPSTTAVILSVPDDALADVAHALSAHGAPPTGCAALHMSGALNTDVLAPLHAAGYAVGSIHPLQSIAHPVTGAERLRGAYFAVSGEPAAVSVGRRLVSALGGTVLSIPVTRRPLYHAAAVVASNALPGLLALAARLLVEAGVPQDEALPAILPLATGSLENVRELGLLPALTGPVARGDVETIRVHLRAMEPREGEVYRSLGRELVILARARGLDPDVADELDRVFSEPRPPGR